MNAVELYKKLPKKQCGECRQKTCMPFALAVMRGEAALSECPHLQAEERERLSQELTQSDWKEALIATLGDELRRISFKDVAEGIGAELRSDTLVLTCLGREYAVSADGENMSGEDVNSGRIHVFNDIYSLGYNALFFVLIVVFTYVYTALMINPTNYAEYLKRSNAFIPGVKPGEATSEYIDNIMTRITLPGAVFLGFIGILPSIAASFGVNQQFALFFGGTTLLIMVGVALDTLQVIESYLLTQKYDGLIKSGRIQGRSTTGVQVGQPQ